MEQALRIPSTSDTARPVQAGTAARDMPVFVRYWRSVQRYKWLIAGILLGCLVLGLIVTLLATPQYSAASRIEISREEQNVTNVESVEGDEAGNSLEFYQTQYALLSTQSLAMRVTRALNLANDPAFAQAFGLEDEADASAASNRVTQQRIDAINEVLQDHIDISPVLGSALVDVTFTSSDPALSAKVANAWVEQFIASNLDRRFAATADARKFLEEQLAELRGKLEQSERDLVSYAADNRIIALSTTQGEDGETRTNQTLVAANLEALNTELAAATAARIRAESELRASRGVSERTLANEAINGLRQQHALLRAEYDKLLTQFEPGYPAAQALKSQIDSLAAAIAREESRVRSGTDTGYRQALARERELSARVEALKREFVGERRGSIQYAIFQREVDTNRQLYDGLLQRYKEIGVAGVGSNNVSIVDRAEPPQAPSSPILALNLAVALLAGVALSAALLVLLESMDQSLKDPQDTNRLLGLPLLGSIPRVKDEEIVESLGDRKSASSEAYLSVRTNLSFLTDHGVPRSFMITSAAPNEGKSISSLALAQSIARTGKRVVLIDSDMRNPSIADLLQMNSADGLTNYLAGADDIDALLRPTRYENLSFLDTGPTPPNAAELLSSDRMGALVRQLGSTFDHIVVDSPPILGLADAPLLSATVEGVILTIEANKHRIRSIEDSLKRMRAANAHMLGAIVTKLDERNAGYGFAYGYGYGYGYGADTEPKPAAVV